jgi:hypothetical protein
LIDAHTIARVVAVITLLIKRAVTIALALATIRVANDYCDRDRVTVFWRDGVEGAVNHFTLLTAEATVHACQLIIGGVIDAISLCTVLITLTRSADYLEVTEEPNHFRDIDIGVCVLTARSVEGHA